MPALEIRAVPPADGERSSVTLVIARLVASAYYESGLLEYRLLKDAHAADRGDKGRADFGEFMRHWVPAVNNLSFALEIHLKVLNAQRTGHYPHGHSIEAAFRGLSADLKRRLQERLVDDCREDSRGYLTDFEVQFREVKMPASFQFRLNCIDENPLNPDDPRLLETEIAACDELYCRWRYLYELGISSDVVAARFESLIRINRVVAAEIDSYSGGVLISGSKE